MLAAYNLFNEWNILTIVWFSVLWGLSIYSIFLIVGSVFMQAFLLNLQIYVKGFTLTLLLAYIAQFMINFFFWADSIEFEQDRTPFGLAAYDLTLWGFIQTVPNIMFLFYFYLFMLDIVNYYNADPNKADGVYNPIIFSVYYDSTMSVLNNFYTWVDKALIDAYVWTFVAVKDYVNPFTWTNWTLGIMSEVWIWAKGILNIQ